MANEKNLIPLNKRPKKEAREIQKKGAQASNAAQRRRRELKEELLTLLSTGNNQEKMSLALIEKAISGDTKAFEVIRDTIGEKPVDIHKLEEPAVIQKIFITPEDKQAVERHIEEALRDGN